MIMLTRELENAIILLHFSLRNYEIATNFTKNQGLIYILQIKQIAINKKQSTHVRTLKMVDNQAKERSR